MIRYRRQKALVAFYLERTRAFHIMLGGKKRYIILLVGCFGAGF